MLEDKVLCSNWLLVDKLKVYQKVEVKLYTQDEHKHICSLYVNITKNDPNSQIQSILKKIKSKGFQRMSPEQKSEAMA